MQFIARHRFKQLILQYCTEDAGPFKPFCDNLQPANMLVDPKTLSITAVLDFEFTNTMPVQFAYDPPWWLLRIVVRAGHLARTTHYRRILGLLRAQNRAVLTSVGTSGSEIRIKGKPPGKAHLSTRIRHSWGTGRFWFNYSIRKSFDVDAVYWAALHDASAGVDLLDDEARAEMESTKQMKMEQ